MCVCVFFFFKQKTAYEIGTGDWSSDVCSSDLSYFGESFPGDCKNCDNCLNPVPLEDWTIEAQKFLSCVARCQERFGMNHVIDVLRGAKKKRLLELGHDQLSTYGIGKDHSVDDWRQLCRSLLHQEDRKSVV